MRGEMPLKACTTREVAREKDGSGSVEKEKVWERKRGGERGGGERERRSENDEKAAPRQLTAHEATAIAGER